MLIHVMLCTEIKNNTNLHFVSVCSLVMMLRQESLLVISYEPFLVDTKRITQPV